MIKFYLFLVSSVLFGANAMSQTCNLFFSEYLEGASNNKALEFYNPLNVTVNLTDYKIYRYNNGSPTPTDSLFPQGTLAPGAVFVAGNPSAIAAILSVSDTLHTITFFNGDDALELRYIPTNTSLDVIGIIGNDPGVNWVVGTGATSEFTLVRMFAHTDGELNWAIASTEWDVYPQNTTTFLGSHTGASCCTVTTSSLSLNACSSYAWAENGMTYTNSGSYNDTLVNANGCDSIITLNLTIINPTTSSLAVSACSSYTWAENGMTYSNSGNYTDTLTNAASCDSIITLNLTINNPTTSNLAVSACSSYTWTENGMTYTNSGSYNDTLVNAASCDSIITLNLTITNPTTSNLAVTACLSYTWAENGMTYTNSGSYSDTLTNAANCDSIITLNLTISTTLTTTETISACDAYTWNTTGITYTNSGQYSDTLSSVSGCDSIVTLNLTISITPTASATDDGLGTLTGSGGNPVQWIDCSTNTVIAGATTTFSPTSNGTYAIIVDNGIGCSDTSNCLVIDYLGLNENHLLNASIYPNPASNEVHITFAESVATLIIVDTQGKLVQTQIIQSGESISLAKLETGIYFFELTTGTGRTVKRIVKQ